MLGRFRALGATSARPTRSLLDLPIADATAANVAGFIMGTAMFSMFLMLTLYMQQVLGLSPLKTGVGYLAVAGTAVIWATSPRSP